MIRTRAILIGWFIVSLALPAQSFAATVTPGTNATESSGESPMIDSADGKLYRQQSRATTTVYPSGASVTATPGDTVTTTYADYCGNVANGIPCLDSNTKVDVSVIPAMPVVCPSGMNCAGKTDTTTATTTATGTGTFYATAAQPVSGTVTATGSWTGTATLTNYIPWTATGTGTAQVVTGADSRLTDARASTNTLYCAGNIVCSQRTGTGTNTGTATVTSLSISANGTASGTSVAAGQIIAGNGIQIVKQTGTGTSTATATVTGASTTDTITVINTATSTFTAASGAYKVAVDKGLVTATAALGATDIGAVAGTGTATGTTNYLPKKMATGWGDATPPVYADGTHIGLNTTSVTRDVEINGVVGLKDGNISAFPAGVKTELNGGIIEFGVNESGQNRWGTYVPANQGGWFRFDTRAGQPLMSVAGRAAGATPYDASTIWSLQSNGQSDTYGATVAHGATSGTVTHGVAATTASYSMLDPATAPAAGQAIVYPAGGGQGTWASVGTITVVCPVGMTCAGKTDTTTSTATATGTGTFYQTSAQPVSATVTATATGTSTVTATNWSIVKISSGGVTAAQDATPANIGAVAGTGTMSGTTYHVPVKTASGWGDSSIVDDGTTVSTLETLASGGPLPSNSSFSTYPTTAARSNFTSAVGFTFTVSAPITVAKLGRLYVSGNAANHVVSLWISTNTSTPLAQATVLAASASDGNNFKWVSITPVALTTGYTYALAVDEVSGGDTWKDEWAPTLQSMIAVTASAYTVTPSAYPSAVGTVGKMYDTGALWYSGVGTSGAIALSGATSGTFTVSPPATVTSYTLTPPAAAATAAGQVWASTGANATMVWTTPLNSGQTIQASGGVGLKTGTATATATSATLTNTVTIDGAGLVSTGVTINGVALPHAGSITITATSTVTATNWSIVQVAAGSVTAAQDATPANIGALSDTAQLFAGTNIQLLTSSTTITTTATGTGTASGTGTGSSTGFGTTPYTATLTSNQTALGTFTVSTTGTSTKTGTASAILTYSFGSPFTFTATTTTTGTGTFVGTITATGTATGTSTASVTGTVTGTGTGTSSGLWQLTGTGVGTWSKSFTNSQTGTVTVTSTVTTTATSSTTGINAQAVTATSTGSGTTTLTGTFTNATTTWATATQGYLSNNITVVGTTTLTGTYVQTNATVNGQVLTAPITITATSVGAIGTGADISASNGMGFAVGTGTATSPGVLLNSSPVIALTAKLYAGAGLAMKTDTTTNTYASASLAYNPTVVLTSTVTATSSITNVLYAGTGIGFQVGTSTVTSVLVNSNPTLVSTATLTYTDVGAMPATAPHVLATVFGNNTIDRSAGAGSCTTIASVFVSSTATASTFLMRGVVNGGHDASGIWSCTAYVSYDANVPIPGGYGVAATPAGTIYNIAISTSVTLPVGGHTVYFSLCNLGASNNCYSNAASSVWEAGTLMVEQFGY